MKRVKGEWWLSPVEMVTDASGKVTVSGFPGDYEVTVNGKKLPFAIGDDTTQAVLHL